MTEQEWLACDVPLRMLRWHTMDQTSTGWRHLSDRKLRLFTCACSRQVPDLRTAQVAAQEARVDAARIADWAAQDAARIAGIGNPVQQANLLRDIAGNPFRPVSLCRLCPPGDTGQCTERQRLLTPTILSLARAAYEERPGRECERCRGNPGMAVGIFASSADPGHGEPCPYCYGTGSVEDGHLDSHRLMVLADALEEAGCEGERCRGCDGGKVWVGGSPYDSYEREDCLSCQGTGRHAHPILAHLRSPGPHVRGCWALDLILGKG